MLPYSSVGKESTCNVGDPGSIPGLGRSPGEGIGYPLQYSWASLVAQLVKNLPQYGRPGFDPWVGKITWKRERLPTPVFWPEEFHGQVHGVTKSWTQLSDTTERHFSEDTLSLHFHFSGHKVMLVLLLSSPPDRIVLSSPSLSSGSSYTAIF